MSETLRKADIAEDIRDKYLPTQGYGSNLAQTVVVCMNRIIFRWYNDGEGIYSELTGAVIGDDFYGTGRNTACYEFIARAKPADFSRGWGGGLPPTSDKMTPKGVILSLLAKSLFGNLARRR